MRDDVRVRRLEEVEPAPSSPERFTAVIPAAGRGSRLGADVPKALVAVAGRPALAWVLDAVRPRCGKIVVVVAPGAVDAFDRALQALGVAATLAVQASPRGMADAVLAAKDHVDTEHVVVAWGDHVSVQPRTVAACTSVHLEGAALTLPTVTRDHPYLELVRSEEGRLTLVREAREGDACSARGESDCGLFVLRAADLFEELSSARAEGRGVGKTTGELSFLPLFPRFEDRPGGVQTIRVPDLDETVGLNTPADLERLERMLRGRS